MSLPIPPKTRTRFVTKTHNVGSLQASFDCSHVAQAPDPMFRTKKQSARLTLQPIGRGGSRAGTDFLDTGDARAAPFGPDTPAKLSFVPTVPRMWVLQNKIPTKKEVCDRATLYANRPTRRSDPQSTSL